MLRFTSSIFLRLVCGFHVADNPSAGFSSRLIAESVSLVWRLTQLKLVASKHRKHSGYVRWKYPCKVEVSQNLQDQSHGDITSA